MSQLRKETSHSWICPSLKLRDARSGGYGVFTTTDLEKGATVVMYGGYVMTLEEEANLPEPLRDFAHQIDDDLVIAPRHHDDLIVSDYINHSCEPNCGFIGQIRLVTMRPVARFEEITFDYAMVLFESDNPISAYQLDCQCGAKGCRKLVTANDWKIPELQHRYRGYFQEFLERKISFG
ncbi:MAG: SET domain-containing protein [Chromatiaceae bacterium]|nr:SET domain-containing protein [Chromatiaceae bacterium]MBP8197087.1 SET domain-containing protein [Chromatiaceae bacterium]